MDADKHLLMMTPDDSVVEGVDVTGMQSVLDQTDVVFAVLFGSRVQGTAERGSDVDLALRFSEELSDRERFQLRNRIDAQLQQYADTFVDVSDIEQLPTKIAFSALRNGLLLVGDEEIVERCREQVKKEYEATLDERKIEQREFIDRLASGDV